jgi:hypothetical protein
MLGEIPQSHNVAIEEFDWEVGKLCNISMKTLWDILISSLLWFI